MLLDKDLLAMWYVGRIGQVRVEALQKILGRGRTEGDILSDRRTRNAIYKWEEEGYCEFRKLQEHERKWVCLTGKGMKTVELPFRAGWAIRDFLELDHSYEVTDLYLRAEDLWGEDLRVLTERELRWQSGNSKDQVYPDSVFEIREDGIWVPAAVEVERTAKSARRIDEKLEALAQRWRNILYFVHKGGTVEKPVLEAVRRLRYQDVYVRVLDLHTWEECE